MKIAVLTPGILPVPAAQGGAVENLIDFYLEYNAAHRLHDITVYSVFHPEASRQAARLSGPNHYVYIDTSSLKARLRRWIYGKTHTQQYYNHYIEYFLSEAIRQMGAQTYDVIILENRPGYASCSALASRARHLVLHLHNDLLHSQSPAAAAIAGRLSKVIAVSGYIARRVATIPATLPTSVVYNGISYDMFRPAADKPALRRQLGIDPRHYVVVFSGRLMPEKGIMQLLQAFTYLTDEPDIRLLVLGNAFFDDVGPDNEFTRELRRMATTIGDHIVFTGFVPYSQVPAYLSAADLAVVPSVWDEPFGLTCIEALACGLPLITTKVGGIPEIIHSDSRHVLLDNDDDLPFQLAQHIRRIMHTTTSLSEVKLDRRFSKNYYAARFFSELNDIIQPQ